MADSAKSIEIVQSAPSQWDKYPQRVKIPRRDKGVPGPLTWWWFALAPPQIVGGGMHTMSEIKVPWRGREVSYNAFQKVQNGKNSEEIRENLEKKP